MAYDDMVKLSEAMENKWNSEHPGVKMPDIDTKEFDAFCDEFLSSNHTSTNTVKPDSDSSTSNVYEDETHRYTKVDSKYIRHAINNWIDKNPGKSLGILFLMTTILSCKVLQHVYAQAVYKGNIRAYKYLMKHVR